ncbi:cytochrome P450 94C1-like [Gossypium australe]|uniref:Cytochrome P450 94C1-like n=1 Tax=Gossypium australe TaxID=47621 RepID=A0A5B6V7H2_9ROSI|nr:cytochrome P450 94C1-like [Gossypium australe]
MDLQASLFILILISLLYLLFSLLIKPKLWCNCEICSAYLTLSWSKQFNNLCDWYTHLLKNSPSKTIHIHVLRNTITANPENIEYMLKTKFHNFPKGKPFSIILGDFLGRGIFNVDGDSWKFQKNMASMELGKTSICCYVFDIINCEIKTRLVPLLSKQDQVLDLQDVFKRFSFDVICWFSFGIDPSCLELSLPMSKLAMAFDLASKLSAERAMNVSPLVWKIKRALNLGSEKELKRAIERINLLAKEVIRQRRKTGFLNSNDLLSRFMSIINDETYLRDIIISFLLAGRDTVASGLTSLFWLLSKHSNVVSAIKQEADRIIGENKELTSFDQMKELHYLQATVYESMRLYPPIQFDSKFCQNDDVLPDGSVLKKGTRVTYHPYAMGRIEEIWGEDCLEFKPERWLKHDGVFSPENPFKYPIFQAGFRVCLGKEMALLEMKTVTLSLIRRFRIELLTPPSPDQHPRKPHENQRQLYGELSSGSGQINPTKAVNPGLIYDINEDLYISFLCKQGYDTRTITLLIGGKKEYHCFSFKPGRGIDGLNYPSMHIYLDGTNPNISAVFHRTVTNVEEGDLEYNVKVASPKELSVVVIPKTLKFMVCR